MIDRRSFLMGALGAAPLLADPQKTPWGCDLPKLSSPFVPPSNGKRVIPNDTDIRLRPNLSTLQGDALAAYQADFKHGYTVMANRSVQNAQDPTGLAFQAWLHGYYCMGSPSIHDDWRFLPWHRAFLYFHEKTLQGIVGSKFRLGVWDWDQSNEIPDYYHSVTQGFSSCQFFTNFLTPELPIPESSLEPWLLNGSFEGGDNGQPHPSSFGGPHGLVHSKCPDILSDFRRAAMHPLFYAHHANVDRFWSFWRHHHPGRTADRTWLETKLDFYDEHGAPVFVQVKDLLDTEYLGYFTSPISTVPNFRSYQTVPLVGKKTPDGKSAVFDATQLQSVVTRLKGATAAARAHAPAGIHAAMTKGATPVLGTYYYVALQASNKGPIIGGFAWFSMGGSAPSHMAITSSFSIDALQFIIDHQGTVSFVWGDRDSQNPTALAGDGNPMSLIDDVQMFVRSPKSL